MPFVSQRALGIVCGMVGAGGNAGSAIVSIVLPGSRESPTDENPLLKEHSSQKSNR